MLWISSSSWFVICLLTAFIHQTYVWLSWRAELNHKWWTRRFKKRGLVYHATIFFVLISLRPLTIIFLSISDMGSISMPRWVYWSGLVLMTVLSGYTIYSIVRYFDLIRATGADHFDDKYKKMPFVSRGMFKYTPNAMYTFALLAYGYLDGF